MNPHIGRHLSEFSHFELDVISTDKTVSLCWGCEVVESIPSNVYIICFECGHVWTRHSLRKARLQYYSIKERILHPLWTILKPTKRIYFCPVCIHDF